eukprot:1712887-Amphidinium_carterae.1
MEAVRQNGHALKYATEKLRGDREVVMHAFRQNGLALWCATRHASRQNARTCPDVCNRGQMSCERIGRW